MTKNAERREKFKKIGQAISQFSAEHAWRDRRGDHQFEIKSKAIQDPEVSSQMADGPVMKSQQWQRTVRLEDNLNHEKESS